MQFCISAFISAPDSVRVLGAIDSHLEVVDLLVEASRVPTTGSSVPSTAMPASSVAMDTRTGLYSGFVGGEVCSVVLDT